MKTQVLTDSGLRLYDQEMKNFIYDHLEDRVEKEDGKGLSTNDYNDEEKNTVAQNKADIENLKKEFEVTDQNKDIVTTTETTLEDSKEGGLVINEIRGKTTQNTSNPSTSSPKVIKSVVINTIKTTNGDSSQKKEITLNNSIELHGIGDVYDVATYENVTRRLIKTVFDGTDNEGWTISNGCLTSPFLAEIIKIPAQSTTPNMLCSMATVTSMNDVLSNIDSIAISADGKLNIYNSYSSNVSGWKTFLQSNPMTVVYELSRAMAEVIPNADIISLCSLTTFEGTTHITTDSEIQPIMEVDYGNTEIGATALESHNNIIINQIIASSINPGNSITYELTKADGKIILVGSDGSTSSVDYSGAITQTYIQETQPDTTLEGSVWIE